MVQDLILRERVGHPEGSWRGGLQQRLKGESLCSKAEWGLSAAELEYQIGAVSDVHSLWEKGERR